MDQPEQPVQETVHPDTSSGEVAARGRGVPFWLPFFALVGSFVLAVVVGARVCPVLTALVFPPEPPLPPGDMTLLSPVESQGVGRDEWLYGTTIAPCDILAYYQERVGGCNLDMNVTCSSPTTGTLPFEGSSYSIGVCQGTQSFGPFYRVTWTIRIGGGYPPPMITEFRITREVAN